MGKEYIAISKPFIKRIFIILLALLFLAAFVSLGWLYQQQRQENERKEADIARLQNPEESAKEAQEQLIRELESIAVVPDEDPEIVRVDDATELKKQEFYGLVENGDVIFLYPSERRQLVYRPSIKKILLAVTLPTESTTPETQSVDQPQE